MTNDNKPGQADATPTPGQQTQQPDQGGQQGGQSNTGKPEQKQQGDKS
jgi:hypothetical protein